MTERPRVFITLREGGENGGPYVSHLRIMRSSLKDRYEFVPLLVPKPRVLMRPGGMARFVREIRDGKPQIVHYAGLQLEGFLVACAIRLAGVRRSVVAVHGSSREAMHFPRHKKLIVAALEALTLRWATVCYGVSEYVTRWALVRRNARHCYGHIYNLPHDVRDDPRSLVIRRELGIPEDAVVLVSTGRIIRDKGFDWLPDVLEAADLPSTVRVLICGEGEYLDTLKERIRVGRWRDRVVFLGYRSDVAAILAASDVFVLLTWHETLGTSIVEAGSEGLPVVATDVGGIPEIVRDGVEGFLVKAGDVDGAARALARLVDDPELRAAMGRNAAGRVQACFGEAEVVRQIDELYRGLMGGAYD